MSYSPQLEKNLSPSLLWRWLLYSLINTYMRAMCYRWICHDIKKFITWLNCDQILSKNIGNHILLPLHLLYVFLSLIFNQQKNNEFRVWFYYANIIYIHLSVPQLLHKAPLTFFLFTPILLWHSNNVLF